MTYTAHVRGAAVHKPYFSAIRRAAESALRQTLAEPGELTIVLTDETGMQDLNRRFADTDEPTDVLSFPAEFDDPSSGVLYHGDVVIGVSMAAAQAERAGHTLESELSLLTVHGVLHLTGYDHVEQDDRRRMWARQSAILKLLGYTLEMPEEQV